MKRILIIISLVVLHGQVSAQLSQGGFHAGFGVDADTRAGYGKFGPANGYLNGDDWFPSSPLSGTAVIDTSNAAYYRSLLQAGNNISFVKRMPVPLYTVSGSSIWLDAVYGRDYIVSSSTSGTSNDSTIFNGGCKNGDDPGNWRGAVGSVPGKTDLVDVYGHMRRNGTSIYDSLWFFTGAAMVGTSGSRYFDIEMYKNVISYNKATGRFSSGGPDGGHTQWLFDAAGNITQTGDMIIAVSYSPGGVPVVEVRIWVSYSTFTSVVPGLFNFSSHFSGSSSYGYASIVSKSGSTFFGSGISNYSSNPASDTTWATPWGTYSLAGGTNQWSPQYESLQFIEVGLNLTRIGLDPALYTSVVNSGACQSSFASIFFKSRSSTSFTSNLQDFIGPLDFLQVPVLDHTLAAPPLITCAHNAGYISVVNNTTAGYYTWTTADGTVIGAGGNRVQVTKGGMYIMKSAVAQGCPVTRTDTIVVPADTLPPVASFYTSVTGDMKYFILHGGDTSASNFTTPFGGSEGLLWNWSGPRGFTATVQNPKADTVYGEYRLIVTEKRNGCKDTAFDYVNLIVLSPVTVSLKAWQSYRGVALQWNTVAEAVSFQVEKSVNGGPFVRIATIPGYHFTDTDLRPAMCTYRVKMMMPGGRSFYSNMSMVYTGQDNEKKCYLVRDAATIRVFVVSDTQQKGRIMAYSLTGAILYSKDITLHEGQTVITIPVADTQKNALQIVSLFTGGRLRYTLKASFR